MNHYFEDNLQELPFLFTPKLLLDGSLLHPPHFEGLACCSIEIDRHNRPNWAILADSRAGRQKNARLGHQSSPKQMRSDVETNRRDWNAGNDSKLCLYCRFAFARERTLHFIEVIPLA